MSIHPAVGLDLLDLLRDLGRRRLRHLLHHRTELGVERLEDGVGDEKGALEAVAVLEEHELHESKVLRWGRRGVRLGAGRT